MHTQSFVILGLDLLLAYWFWLVLVLVLFWVVLGLLLRNRSPPHKCFT